MHEAVDAEMGGLEDYPSLAPGAYPTTFAAYRQAARQAAVDSDMGVMGMAGSMGAMMTSPPLPAPSHPAPFAAQHQAIDANMGGMSSFLRPYPPTASANTYQSLYYQQTPMGYQQSPIGYQQSPIYQQGQQPRQDPNLAQYSQRDDNSSSSWNSAGGMDHHH